MKKIVVRLTLTIFALLLVSKVASAQTCQERSNVLLIVDRSISMQTMIGDQTKWDIATGAIDAMLTGYGNIADFGLMIYPYADDGGGDRGVAGDVSACRADMTEKGCEPLAPRCSTGEVVVEPGQGTTSAIIDALAWPANLRSSFTPTWQTLQYAATVDALQEQGTRNYAILITDGYQCCGVYENETGAQVCENFNEERDQIVPAITALRAAGVTTFVVGFGDFDRVDPYTLHDSAIAAGTPRVSIVGGAPTVNCDVNAPVSQSNQCYYQASNAIELNAFLNTIGTTIETEVCDQVDNDCDGRIDENVVGSMDAEVCDQLDNDCDGLVDEGLLNACGTCGPPPTETCNARDDDCDRRIDEGVRNACNGCGEVPPERCNGEDDDCDGDVDEDFTNLGDACRVGVGACERTGVYVCGTTGARAECDAVQGAPSVEECNLIDDDCDGRVDEDTGPDCGSELCDGEDNDGDGRIDEGGVEDGQQCESDLFGLCAQGFTECVDGELVCQPRSQPVPERCNDIDDDCDGEIDEDASDKNRCGTCGPAPLETCNGLDENCNGIADDNAPCEMGSLCACGGCAPPCSAGECGNGGRCIDGYCVVDQCPDGFVCLDNQNCTPGTRPTVVDMGSSTNADAGIPTFVDPQLSPQVDDCKCDFQSRKPSTWFWTLLFLLPFTYRRKHI